MMSSPERMAIRIKGIVQGVGFRPFIFNMALEYGLVGWVTNDSAGVLLEVEGSRETVEAFLKDIPVKVPPLARIDSIEHHCIEPLRETDFTIKATDRSERVRTLISPDMATCPDCLRELLDPKDKRYLYPFINCTNCGPRFTIIEEMPYDRPFTTMREFVMCGECQAEYEDPRNRRFHAQPNACPECGPAVRLTDGKGQTVLAVNGAIRVDSGSESPVGATDLPAWALPVIRLRVELADGKVAGVKGLGGYHLVADAFNATAVMTLRARKHRPDKPLAVMMPDLQTVEQFCEVSPEERKLLESPSRPIVLLRWKAKGQDGIALEVAMKESRLGVMLPYTPLHHMLFDERLKVLVMTSGNMSGEPIIYDDDEAVKRLGQVVDYFLMHNRKIVRPCDDSVMRVDAGPIFIRRSRGYAPQPLTIKGEGWSSMPSILACGGELKNSFALTTGEQVFMSQFIGDLKTRNSLHHYRRMIDEMRRLFEINPEVVAYDLHPGYLSSKYAEDKFSAKRLIQVQHHHGHIASCMAEHGLLDEVIGLSFDGTGYGTDGKIWGGEVLVATPVSFLRWAHLRYLPLPGGDQAIQEPWRIGAAYLEVAMPGEECVANLPFWQQVNPAQVNFLREMLARGIQTPETSSMGRFFDGVAAIMGIRTKISFEGQAAIELEELAAGQVGEPYPFGLEQDEFPVVLDPVPTIRAIVEDILRGADLPQIAQRFHGTVIEMAYRVALVIREIRGLNRVALSGGVFMNRLLSLGLRTRLVENGFEVYQHEKVPANDGGLALGQVYVAGHTLLLEGKGQS